MKYLSVCSGIEAASVAWHPLGWQPAAFSEIEPFPSAVLAHHYPNVPNLGDMTKFQEWPDEPVDLLVGGTPCQSFSVAGLRKGLEDPRGNLMLTYLAIAQRYRPRWLVWENVPGVLSSNGGRDFGTFLGALGELGYGWAYRVLDAQWFGVAQRRRRVFVVGYLGDWHRAAKVLFERESVRRDSPPSREARQGAAASVGGGTYLGNAEGGALDAPYLTCSNIDSHVNNQTPLVAQQVKCATGDITHALTTRSAAEEDGTGRGTPLVPVVFKVRGGVDREDGSRGSTNIGKQAGKGYLGSEERAFTLAAAQDQFVAQPVAFHNRQDPDVSGDITHPLGAKDNGMAVAQPITQFGNIAGSLTARHDSSPCADRGQNVVAQPVYGTDCYNGAITGDVAATLGTPGSSVNASGPTVMQPIAIHPHVVGRAPTAGPQGKEYIDDGSAYCMDARGVPQSVAQPVATVMQVRRLTPVECERLQGFPDNYTNIPWRKKPEAPDGPRYKALGNSMAVPCMAWIGQRIAEVDRGD